MDHIRRSWEAISPQIPMSDDLTGRVIYDAAIVALGNDTFLYIPCEDGGRLIQTNQIKSIVPDYRRGGSMVFLAGVEKALSISQSSDDIVDSLLAAG